MTDCPPYIPTLNHDTFITILCFMKPPETKRLSLTTTNLYKFIEAIIQTHVTSLVKGTNNEALPGKVLSFQEIANLRYDDRLDNLRFNIGVYSWIGGSNQAFSLRHKYSKRYTCRNYRILPIKKTISMDSETLNTFIDFKRDPNDNICINCLESFYLIPGNEQPCEENKPNYWELKLTSRFYTSNNRETLFEVEVYPVDDGSLNCGGCYTVVVKQIASKE